MHFPIQFNLILINYFIIITTTINRSEAGILDWFRSKPKWFPKLEKNPLIETFDPKGLRISISDFNGLQVFDFHGKINEQFLNKKDNGTIKFTMWEPINGRWIYTDKNLELKEGDILYYWYYIKVNGEEYWSPKSIKSIINVAPYPGEDLRFPRLQDPLCPCDFSNSAITHHLYSSNYIQCDREEYKNMKKELENARVQINVLLETLLLLQKSDRNVPTLILTGKSLISMEPIDDVRRFLKTKLDITDLDEQIKKAHYTDCGILFELDSLIDMERVLVAANREIHLNDERKIYEPENAECNTKHDYELISSNHSVNTNELQS